MRRGAAIAGGALGALALGLLLSVVVERAALSRAEAIGARWESLERGPLRRTLLLVELGPVTVEALRWSAAAPRRLRAEGARVELSSLLGGGEAPGEGAPNQDDPSQDDPSQDEPSQEAADRDPLRRLERLPTGLVVELEGVDLTLNGEPLVEGLYGYVEGGALRLENSWLRLQVPGPLGERAWAQATREVPHEAVEGEVTLTARLSDSLDIELVGEGLSLRDERLSSRPLPLASLRAQLEADPAARLAQGTLRVDGVSLDLELSCAELCAATLSAEAMSFAEALAPFAPWLPELEGAALAGTLNLGLAVSADGVFLQRLGAEGLRVEGAVPKLGALRGGPFSYTVRDAEGEAGVRLSGEGSPGWTSLRQVSPWLPAAVIAAEDSTFREHDGYDLVAIQEAWQANLDAGSVVRGGSTLTQQLAKNLFLDGRRTAQRKLRELLLAIELDRALGKDRVMELYLNVVEWGPELWGVAEAADRYFLKRPATLQPHEAAFLAAVLPDPKGMYQRWYLQDRAGEVRIDWILHNMADGGAFSHAEAQRWSEAPLRFVPPPR